MQRNRFYVVWKGYAPGVYDSWEEAEIQVSGYPEAQYRSYSSMEDAVEAFRNGYDRDGLIQEVQNQIRELNKNGFNIEWDPDKPTANVSGKAEGTKAKPKAESNDAVISKSTDSKINYTADNNAKPTATENKPLPTNPPYIRRAIAVDASCPGNPGPVEYRCVYLENGQQLFHAGPFQMGTNNIGEFLAIVHGMGFLEKQNLCIPIYSDSVNAQLWVRQGKCKTKLERCPENAQLFDLIERAENWLSTHKFRVNIYKWDTKAWGEIPADFGRK